MVTTNGGEIMDMDEDGFTVEKSKPEFAAACSLTWKDLTVMITLSNGKTQTILDQLSGYAEPGTLTALIGPSGSGKSTLLDTLSGRLAPDAFLSGAILLNGRKAKLSFGKVAYVTQDENLIGTLTVRETIAYSAQLRLPDKMPWSEKTAIVENTILEMGLQDCADTVIGNWHLRGISGGERRRVSIAIEILMRPRLLFLDEPTSGLDSASAFFVTQTLRGLSTDKRTVIASIHQPSSEVFELFDRLCLLSGGRTVYFGEASQADEFFTSAGFPCPALSNPADHFIRCINSDFDKVRGSVKLQFETDDDPLEKVTAAEAIQILVESYRSSEYCSSTQEKIEEISKFKGSVVKFGGSEASFLKQAITLTQRSFVNMSRDFGYYWLRLVIFIVVTISIGTIYLDVGTSFKSIQARGACSSFVFGFVTFMCIGGFPSFVEDMKVFRRERLNGHYGVGAFVISNTLSAMPFLIMISIISGTICYFMVHFHPGFWHYAFFVLCLYASVTVVESLMMAIASIVPNFLLGILVGAGIQGIFMLVSGFFRLPDDMPKVFWRYPMSYLSFHFWALQGQYQNDLKGLMFDNQSPDLPKISGEFILEYIFQIDAFESAWATACKSLGNPKVIVPSGRTFLVSSVKFAGPCKSRSITFEILGTIIAHRREAWRNADVREWLYFHEIEGLSVVGNELGVIDGQGDSWWHHALRFSHCNNLHVTGLKHKNSQKNHISINGCNNVNIANLHITAPATSPNTDGIDISSSTNVHIQDCIMATGDDCIAINGGTSIVNISRITCGPGHGISIGSLGKDGKHDEVEGIHVDNCTFIRTQNGVRIKTWQGGAGFAKNIIFSNINFESADHPIIIDQQYCPHKKCNNAGSNVKVSDVKYLGIRGTSISKNATINLSCSEMVPCTGIVLENVNIKVVGSQAASVHCINAYGSAHICNPIVNCLKS
ncbi:white-brown complex-like protein [Perilla frutescens var. frutescens]|nr:white-brown complex-like protein [Perilla frutescens var. frutescens]